MLAVQNLDAFYGDFQALFGIHLRVAAGETVALVGANGAGKSSLLKSICGQLRAPSTAISFDDIPIGGLQADLIVRRGIAMVPEGRRLFRSLTVEENLRIGAFSQRPGPWNLERVYRLFPMLKEKRTNSAIALSGGQQQMVAIGRALMANPRLLICDEISLGLAPVVVRDIYAALPEIVADGLAIILVEQDIDTALKVADQVVCLMHGRVSLTGPPHALSRAQIADAYFGITERSS